MCSSLGTSVLNCGLLEGSTGPKEVCATLPDDKIYMEYM